MKTCLECGTKLVGREDKKFCDDSCRNSYNNKVNKDFNNLVRNTNNQLRKNYRILRFFNKSGKTKIPISKLLQQGYDFQLFTSIYQTKTGTIYYFVYNQGYLNIDTEYCLLVQKK
ncbi:hypothetical protein [Flavobacterium sp. NKUCC04_CG]|uniref:hypothetical protein n=1 Tax=Flavobacterium sp. NKUCC04_CG TaxID=2842121 RepID=UPI001C5A6C60|nr:hypothetical protein [Flavobacterium sp. NKUCC04_CG]MBW3518760.1 hypothetical protein [Flavobacterium sp. NKUCC04_CG]